MNLKNDVTRLERAGFEYSVWMEKLRDSVRNLVAYLAKVLPRQRTVELPRDYIFVSWSSGQWKLKNHKEGKNRVNFGEGYMDRQGLLTFASDVEQGWLNELSQFLEEETGRYRRTFEAIEKIVTVSEKDI